jgi:hypothetical protein
MKRRDIVIGLIVVALIAGTIYLIRRRNSQETPLKTNEPTTEETESRLEDTFKLDIPEDLDKAQLKDVTGGTSTGIATREFVSGKFTHTALVDLPDPAVGYFYEGWLVKGDQYFSTGKLRIAKGGYLLEFQSGVDYSDYDKVVITLEKVFDKTPEQHVLEGTF